jgi:ribonuclease P protein component
MSDEAHLSAEQPGTQAASRVPRPHGDGRRPQHPARAPRPRPQVAERLSEPAKDAGQEKGRAILTIGKRADFLAANKGRRMAMPGFVLLVHDRGDGDPAKRLGITVTKKIGGAVVRNRMKRRFRALARELLPKQGMPGADHILIGRAGGVERDFGKLREEMAKALRKIAQNSRHSGESRNLPRQDESLVAGGPGFRRGDDGDKAVGKNGSI